MKSVPADWLVFDELDEATPDAKSLAKERLGHSDYKRLVELSNPSLPDYGIDEAFQLSDQRHWTVKCPGCGHWTALDKEFPKKLGRRSASCASARTGASTGPARAATTSSTSTAASGSRTSPTGQTHGYLISQLISSKVDPGEILREYRTTRFPERFYNLKIGIAWADTQNRLTVEDVLACCGEHGMVEESTESCTMGVDTGKDLHVVIARCVDQGEAQGHARDPVPRHAAALRRARRADEAVQRRRCASSTRCPRSTTRGSSPAATLVRST